MLAVTLSKADVFKGSANRNVPGACTHQKDYLTARFSSLKKSRSGKYHFNVIMERYNVA